jgi:hypothetical protein
MDAEPGWVHNDQGDRSASIINIDNGKTVAAVAVCAALAGMAAMFAWHATTVADASAMESRLQLNHTMQLQNDVDTLTQRLKERTDAVRP